MPHQQTLVTVRHRGRLVVKTDAFGRFTAEDLQPGTSSLRCQVGGAGSTAAGSNCHSVIFRSAEGSEVDRFDGSDSVEVDQSGAFHVQANARCPVAVSPDRGRYPSAAGLPKAAA